MNDKYYIFSPFIRVNPKIKNGLINYLTRRLEVVNDTEMAILKFCTQPRSLQNIELDFSNPSRLIHRLLILESGMEWKINRVRQLEIETTTICNWKCKYCPNHIYTQKRNIMSLDLFEEIICKAKNYGYLKWVTLHAYNEPTIDPHFIQRINILKKYDMKLVLYTNGTGLNESSLLYLKDSKVLRNIVFNLPTTCPDDFYYLTQYKDLDKVIRNIKMAVQLNINTKISVQGTVEQQIKGIQSIKTVFPNIECVSHASFDRAGIIKNEINKNIHNDERFLSGCGFILSVLHIAYNGDCYLCIEDYHKKIVYGNIRNATIEDLMNSNKFIQIKKIVWGNIEAPNDYPCRQCIVMNNIMHT